MPIAAIALDFDPFLRIDGTAVRLETVGVAAAVFVALVVAAWTAVRTPVDHGADGRASPEGATHLRIDDLVFVVLGVVPGAVAGGRLGYVLIHADYYAANPGAILDPAQGSLELAVAVVGGAITGAVAARLLGEPVGHWFHAAALPTVAGIALGKLAMALGGAGQGAPADVPWATQYLGAGPWGSLAPSVASHPAQVYEAIATGLIVIALTLALSAGVFARRDGVAFFAAVGSWAAARVLVAEAWRDAEVAGPLGADQLVCIGMVVGCVALGAGLVRRRATAQQPDRVWPDAEAASRS